jgi:hypothetical protein
MSPEHSPEPGMVMKSVQIMDYHEISSVAKNFNTPRNLNVLKQELLRRSAHDGAQEDPLFQEAWDVVQGCIQEMLQNS